MTKLRHYDEWDTCRFITFGCHNRLSLLTDQEDILIFLETLKSICHKYEISLLGYVVMPDHVHLLLLPQRRVKLGQVIGEIKSLSARRIIERWRSRSESRLTSLQIIRDGEARKSLWLRRCYDHNCRSIKSVLEKIQYCHNNPVNRGLVDKAEDWQWSSYRFYKGSEDTVLSIDINSL